MQDYNEAASGDAASIRKYALLMAGGSGLRAGGDLPKQMQPLLGVPMLIYSIRAFLEEDANCRIILVLNDSCREQWLRIAAEYPDAERLIICGGGKDRLQSVINGLRTIPPGQGRCYVAIHDAARPMLTPELVRRGWECALEKGSAVPVVPEVNSLRYLPSGNISDKDSKALDRARYYAVQTPQIFEVESIKNAYSRGLRPEFTDDASVYEAAGGVINLYEGSPENFKVTNPIDFLLASAVLASR